MSKLLLLPLLLLVLTLAAGPASAAKVTITLPLYNNDVWEGQVGLAWRVDPTQPMETWDGIAKVEYWMDGALEHTEEYPHLPDPNAKGPLSILSWTYDGRQDGELTAHNFEIKVWVWKQTWVYFPFPPTITWSKLDVTPETTPQFILNQPPQLNANMAIASDRTTATLSGSVVPTNCTLTLNGAAITVDGTGHFNHVANMQEGTNELVLLTTDPATTLTASWQAAVFRAMPVLSGLPSSCDITNGVPVTFSSSLGTAARLKVVLWDPAHFTKVCTLWDGMAQQGVPVQLSWAGSSGVAYQYNCANGHPPSGNYVLRAYTLSDSCGCGGIVSQNLSVTNNSTPPSYTAHEFEYANQDLSITSGDWHLLQDGDYSSLYCIEGTGDSSTSPVVQVTFSGDCIDVVYTKLPSGRTATLSVDSQQVGTIDCSSIGGTSVGQVAALTQLGIGDHTLTITGVPDGNDCCCIALDAYRTY